MAKIDLTCVPNNRFNPLIQLPTETFDIRDGLNTKVRITNEQNLKIFRVDQIDYSPPLIVTNNNPVEAEVGENIGSGNVRFTINEGSEAITGIVSTPDHSPFVVTQEKDIPFTNLTRNTPGLGNQVDVTITDAKGIQTLISVGIPFKERFFQGINLKADLNEAEIEALVDISSANGRLSDGILSLYGGEKTYVLPSDGFVRYIHWLYPVGTPGISGGTYNGLPLPIQTLSNKSITNSHGLAVELVHKRTSGAFGGGSYNFILA